MPQWDAHAVGSPLSSVREGILAALLRSAIGIYAVVSRTLHSARRNSECGQRLQRTGLKRSPLNGPTRSWGRWFSLARNRERKVEVVRMGLEYLAHGEDVCVYALTCPR